MDIGIDPGKNTGLAIIENGKLIDLITTNFWGAIEIINNNLASKIFIERPVNDHIHHGYLTPRSLGSIGVDVGRVMREAELLIEFCRKNRIAHKVMAPNRKIDHETFCKITGWEMRTNQHQRDAAMLVWGMSAK